MEQRAPLAVVPQARTLLNQTQSYNLTELERIAMAMARSGFFEDSRDASQAFVKILAGKEYALGPMAAMTGVYIVKGRPTLAGVTIGGLIKRSGVYGYKPTYYKRGENGKFVPVDDEMNDVVVGCSIEFTENGVPLEPRSTFTDVDAARAGLSNGENWKKYPKAMYFNRALSAGARMHCPELFGGAIYTPEELSDKIIVDASGIPVNYDSVSVVNGSVPALTSSAQPAGKPRELKDIKAMFDAAQPFLPPNPDGSALKLGGWLELSGVAPGINGRTDPITGRKTGLTPAESLAAEAALRELLLERNPEAAKAWWPNAVAFAPEASIAAADPVVAAAPAVVMADFADEPEPTPAEAAQLQFAAATGADVGGGYCPPGSSQHKRVMALFTKRSKAIKAKYDGVGTADERRHQFAIEVLGDQRKGSSSSWSYDEYQRVCNALELIPPDKEEA